MDHLETYQLPIMQDDHDPAYPVKVVACCQRGKEAAERARINLETPCYHAELEQGWISRIEKILDESDARQKATTPQ